VWPDFKKTAEAPVVLSPLSMALQIDPASFSACVWVFGGCPCAVWTWLSKSTYAVVIAVILVVKASTILMPPRSLIRARAANTSSGPVQRKETVSF